MKVDDPQGRTWRVTRRWTPWRRRFRDVVDPAVPDAGGLDGGLSVVVAIVVAVVVLPLLVTAAIMVLELLLLALLVPFVLLGRVLLGRRWVVEVREGFRARYEEVSGDWAASGRRIGELAEALRDGSFAVPRDPDDPDRVVRHDPGPPASHGRREAW